MASRASAASACSLRNMTWTRCSRMPTTSSCWCAARSLPPAGPMRCAPTRACARSIWAAAAVRRAAPHGRRPRQAEAAMGSEAILEVEGLDAAYGLAQILFNVSLSVARGEIVALMGRNGAGKSTTLKAIMGLVPANARALRFAGRDIRGMPSYRIARLGLGYVPEERRIFTDLTIAENLQVGTKAAIGGEARAPWTPDRLYA